MVVRNDTSPLSARIAPEQLRGLNLDAVDLEEQTRLPLDLAERGRGSNGRTNNENRTGPFARLFPRFCPILPSWLSVAGSPRLGPGSPNTQNESPSAGQNNAESPKAARFCIGSHVLPHPRLELPGRAATCRHGPASRRNSESVVSCPQMHDATPPVPLPIVPPTAANLHPALREAETRRGRGSSVGQSVRQHRVDNSGLVPRADYGRGRRHGRWHRTLPSTAAGRHGGLDIPRPRQGHRRQYQDGRHTALRDPPSHFLLCVPRIKSRRLRTQCLRCVVSAIFLVFTLSIYLVLSITKNMKSSEFTVLLILVILFVTIVFCHGFLKLCMLIVHMSHGGSVDDHDAYQRNVHLPTMFGPGGYAIPCRPIRVLLARDEEAAGLESVTTKTTPPAYGLWRESVRVDPNRIYWMRNEEMPPLPKSRRDEGGASWASSSGVEGQTRRPPSYVSEDGVAYVVEAQPRSIAPSTDVLVACPTETRPPL